MDFALFGSVFVTLFVIMDPTGLVPIFLGMVSGRSPREIRRLATFAVLTSLGVIVGFALFGDAILDYLNISLPALQGAGGLLLLLVALQLLLSGSGPVSVQTEQDATSIALVPLGVPLLAGPGAIVATILFVRESDGAQDLITIAAGILAIHVVIWLAMAFAPVVMRVLRPAGVLIVSRIAGLLLAAIAVELIASAVAGFIDAG